jgi:sulfate adenylyltransferase subunit 1
MDILRFMTAGSVDDGKSTLIGRLLYDSKSILIDQLQAIEKHSKRSANGGIDLALLTDGLRAEREQGITIDVAYKYFSTPKRKFVIADAPGHVQYTRNMITGASNSDLIIILVDARIGISEQTKRHSIIASLLRIKHVVVAINKMDLVNYSQDVFNAIVEEYNTFASLLNLKDIKFIPISALTGENIVDKSESFHWYTGEALLNYLEEVKLDQDVNLADSRFPVQYVIRPQTPEFHDYRGYAGKITSGVFQKGDAIVVMPSGLKSKIKSIELGITDLEKASASQSVIIQLEDDIDISRGDVIVGNGTPPELSNRLDVLICWMDEQIASIGKKYIVQINSKRVRCVIDSLEYKLDVNTLEQIENPTEARLNELVKAKLKTATPVVYDKYANIQETGGAILIDETSNLTVGACIIL